MATKFTITVGLDCSLAYTPIPVDEARQFVLDKALEFFPEGHTIREATGRWRSDSPVLSAGSNIYSTTVTEPTVEVVWCTEHPGEGKALVEEFALQCREHLSQESVMVSIEQLNLLFI